MILKKPLILFALLLLLVPQLFAQDGFIRGTVYEATTAEPLPGVTVFLEGTIIGAMTDFDGKFSITAPAGKYNLRVSFISFETINIQDVVVESGKALLFENLRMEEANVLLQEVVVKAEVIRNSESAILSIKKKSAGMIDGISSSNFRKIGDSDAASSMKRVPGVSVEGGKYVYVRGLGDRYTKTTLNGMDIPGLDPDRNTLQMDIFPTNVIDNIIIAKTFSVENPADFTGGAIDIATKDFPEVRKASISLSLGYNPAMHFNQDYLTYEGGKYDFLGFDDGTRKIPATENIPFFSSVIAKPESEEGLRYREILGAFNPTLSAMRQNSLMDYSLGISYGDQHNGKKVSWGYNVAISYKNTTEYYEDTEFGRYGLSGDANVVEMEEREYTFGDYGSNNALLGGLVGLALKTEKSKYRINLLHLQNGESKAGVFDYRNADQGAIFYGFQHNLEYSERAMTNLLFNGKHFYSGSKWEIEWKISPTRSTMDDPDVRFTRYEDREGSLSIGTESGFPERIWRELSELNVGANIQASKEFEMKTGKLKLNFGSAYVYKEREYSIRTFALNIRNVPLTGDPNELMLPENLWPLGGSISKGTTYEADFVPVNPNSFDANTQNTAGYVSVELTPFNRFKTVIGLRAENYTQRYTGQDQLGTYVLDNEVVLESLDFFPSVNVIYNLKENQNLRFSYGKTIARPSFKELSYAEISDPITSRTFIGGLFRDANDIAGIVYWDGNLQSSDIHNLDLRWELFQQKGQTISLSAFYKSFIRPIEMVQFVTQAAAFQPRNVGDGRVIGTELELRKTLGVLGTKFDNFAFSANLTFTNSRIRLSETEYVSRVDNAREGERVLDYRQMAGQAPYIINAGFNYEGGEKGFLKGLEAGFYYNVQGTTLLYVGIVDRPNVYTLPFHSLNFNANKSFGKDNKMSLGVKVDNILNDSKSAVFRSCNAQDQFFGRLLPGRTFSLRFSYSIF
ncbi:MAG: tonb-dependent receptor [Bacteroidetes bacterium]|nr:MAG: tonb-dependent receptor [Bacteroidota bacterium]